MLDVCDSGARTGRELMKAAGYNTRTGNFKRSLSRLLKYGFLEMTIPEKPNSRLQKYRLTAQGKDLLGKMSEGNR